jgi:hypothetical protein
VHGTEANIRTVQPDVPEALATLVDHALALLPADRLSDAESFADAIDAYLLSVGEPCPSARGHEPRAAQRDSLPALMHSLFERDRVKLRGLVDRHLQRLQSAQYEVEVPTSERVFVAVAEVETSGWTSIRDLSGQSGLHSLSRSRGDESTVSVVLDSAELGSIELTSVAPGPAGAGPVEAEAEHAELFEADEPTRPRIAADLASFPRSRTQGSASTAPENVRAHEPAFGSSLARGTGNFERAHVRTRAATAMLLVFGALSGGALAWFAPTADVEAPTESVGVVVLPEPPASSASSSELAVELPPPLAEPAVVYELSPPSVLGSRAEDQRALPGAPVVEPEPVVTERLQAALPLFVPAPEGALRPVAQKQAVGQVRKPAVFAKKAALLRPASSGVARPRAPVPVPFKPTVERNPYLR